MVCCIIGPSNDTHPARLNASNKSSLPIKSRIISDTHVTCMGKIKYKWERPVKNHGTVGRIILKGIVQVWWAGRS